MEIKLDEGVPIIPTGRRKREDPRAAQLLAMPIGTGKNSFYIEGSTYRATRSLRELAKRINVTLVVREFKDHEDEKNELAGCRVWRVAGPNDPKPDDDF